MKLFPMLFCAVLLCPFACKVFGEPQIIRPGEPWLDDRGQHVQAHGGGVIKLGDTFYWFGEDRSRDNDKEKRYVSCYSSKDLAHWQFRHQVLVLTNITNLQHNWVVERPKVFYNGKTKKFVMYFHLDGALPGEKFGYGFARVGVATCDTVDGNYVYQNNFRPLGHESRDIGQFIDDDGSAYLIFEDRPFGFRIGKLSDDYLTVEKEICLVPEHLESGAIVRHDGLYYFIGSQLTGWNPNPNKYATAKSLAGPWSEFKDIAPESTNTYGSQSTMLLKIVGTKTTSVIFMADIWKPSTQWDSRYLWMPLEIGDGQLRLPEPRPWTLDIKTGEARILGEPAKTSNSAIPKNSDPATVSIQVAGDGYAISPDLFGIFFEDINYAADGGLYAELIQNRSFEYSATEQPTWNELTSWELTQQGGSKGAWEVGVADPICATNPHYVILQAFQPGEGVGLVNNGFDGIVVKAGEKYDVSFFARQLYLNQGYGADANIKGKSMPMVARLENKDGTSLGEVALNVEGADWKRFGGIITATGSDDAARFVLLMKGKGGIAVDEISLFPQKTFRNRPNGLRPDLAQTIADLHPKFMRFPGGCVAHGWGLDNIYRWKDTIGPVEQRRGQKNFWRYHQSVGLGYFEYFQFCEDIGAKPLPVLAAGVCCPNSDQRRGKGQQCIPLADMPAYVQDILDLIEWANGPADSKWGAKRAAAGHPAPFHLEYIGIGNEDLISPEFKERFKMIQEAIQAKHPEITVIGTVGGHANDENFHVGWKFANELNIPMVDEHYYEMPQWFLDNWHRYDNYDRKATKVYVGEYASRGNAWSNALAEASYMTTLERNGDVVRLASYAPLLANQKHTQWRPDMIYFDNTRILRTANYHVQQMFMQNQGDVYLPVKIAVAETNLAASCVRDTKSGDVILKLVNVSTNVMPARLDITGLGKFQPNAARMILAGELGAVNKFEQPDLIVPTTDALKISNQFDCDLPASSFTLIRLNKAE